MTTLDVEPDAWQLHALRRLRLGLLGYRGRPSGNHGVGRTVLTMRFDDRQFPPLKAGWKRDYLLRVEGWAKDRDANTAYSQSVMPLPFHAMSRYPYPADEHYPDDPLHRAYIKNYLTRPALRLIRPLAPWTEMEPPVQ